MTRDLRRIAFSLAFMLAACGEGTDPPTGPVVDPSLTGTFQTDFAALSGDTNLSGRLTFELVESAGTLTGAFDLRGTLDDAGFQYDVSGTGTVTGVVGVGDIANVTIEAHPDYCPDQDVPFTGTFNRLTGVLYLDGAIFVVDSTCAVLFGYSLVVALNR